MLCSILIPTRGRPEGFWRTVQSIDVGYGTIYPGRDPNMDYEILARVDDDDCSLKGSELLEYGIKYLVGPRLDGWKSCHVFYTELCNIARGDFVWVMNDDAVVHGPWFDRLVEAPKRAFIQPENYGLNESTYHECLDVGFPIIPRNAWLEYDYVGKPLIPNPIDSQTYELLVRQNNWPTFFLKGVTVQHNRKADATLGKERL